jgi:hypothetical protein
VLSKNMAFPTIQFSVSRFFLSLFIQAIEIRADNTIIIASQFSNRHRPHKLRVVGEDNQQRKAIDMTMANDPINIEV